MVFEEADVPRVIDNRRHIRGHKHFALADADDHATGVPDARRHQCARCVDTQRHDGIAPFEHGRRAPQCFGKIARVRKMQAQQVGNHFGVGLRHKGMTLGDEVVFQLEVVFDDAVLDDHHPAAGVAVGVCVLLGDVAVRRPAGMPDAHRALYRRRCQHAA